MLTHSEDLFSNGVRLILVPMSGATSCAMRVTVANGSMDEEPGKNGISHFLEHVCSRGRRTSHRHGRSLALSPWVPAKTR